MNKTDYTLNLKPAVYEVLEKVFRDNQIFSAEDLKHEVLKIYSGALRSHLASVSRPLWDYRASFLNITGQREAKLYECKN